MMEEFLRRVIKNYGLISNLKDLRNIIPSYFKVVTKEYENDGFKNKNMFMERNIESYLELTEDRVWNLVCLIADTNNSKIPKQLQELAKRLLERRIFDNFRIKPGKEGILENILRQNNYDKDKHFTIVDTHTTAYKSTTGKRVFVEFPCGKIEGISELSELISIMRDRQESEYLLIGLDLDKASFGKLRKLAENVQAI